MSHGWALIHVTGVLARGGQDTDRHGGKIIQREQKKMTIYMPTTEILRRNQPR